MENHLGDLIGDFIGEVKVTSTECVVEYFTSLRTLRVAPRKYLGICFRS